jgi:hypothetical protein
MENHIYRITCLVRHFDNGKLDYSSCVEGEGGSLEDAVASLRYDMIKRQENSIGNKLCALHFYRLEHIMTKPGITETEVCDNNFMSGTNKHFASGVCFTLNMLLGEVPNYLSMGCIL